MTKATHVLSSICLLLVLLLLYSPAAVQGQSPAQQIVNDAADALGGRDRVLAVKTLLLEGEGKEFSFGQGSSWTEMGQEASVWKVMGYRRAYDLTGSRARFEQSRTPLYAFFAGHIPGKSAQAIDADVAFNIGGNGAPTRVWGERAVADQRVEYHRHPLTLVRAALDPTAVLSNGRAQGAERLVDIRLPRSAITVTLAIDSATKLPSRVVWMTDIAFMGDIAVETRFGDYVTVNGMRLPTRLMTRNEKY